MQPELGPRARSLQKLGAPPAETLRIECDGAPLSEGDHGLDSAFVKLKPTLSLDRQRRAWRKLRPRQRDMVFVLDRSWPIGQCSLAATLARRHPMKSQTESLEQRP